MSLKLGNTPIAGISTHTNVNAHSLFDFKWADHRLNEVSWLEASTFSWQSGGVYVTAYNHLVADLQGTTAETETIGSYTITFYRATDGHKIVLADQETTVANIYSETGIAWYYIVDTTNTQFKLPRTKFGFEGLRTNVGDKIEAGLPNITGTFGIAGGWDVTGSGQYTYGTPPSGAFANIYQDNHYVGGHIADSSATSAISFDASSSNSIYGNSNTVQEQATQMYLYFYVGDYSQTAIEQTAGINSELFNGKADVDLSNCTKPHIVETYVNGTSWYRVYSDGWCEQGGFAPAVAADYQVCQITFLKPFTNTNYYFNPRYITTSWINAVLGVTGDTDKQTTGIKIWNYNAYSSGAYWYACGYIN